MYSRVLGFVACLAVVTMLPAHAQEVERATGLIFADEEDYRSIPLASAFMRGDLPSRKDLSSWFPVPGDQGAQSSCVGWAVAYGLKTYQEAVERKVRPTLSTTFSPSYIYNQIKGGGCQAGSHIYDALNLVRSEGVAPMSEFRYDARSCDTEPDTATKNVARPFTIADWRRVDISNEVEVKSQITSGFPVVIGMYIDHSFQNLSGNNVYRGRTGPLTGGHAMVVVGYDDGRGAYKVLNSWGASWGDGGFGWISYNAFANQVREAYTAQDVIVTDPTVLDDIDLELVVDERDVPAPAPTPSPGATATLLMPMVMHNQRVLTEGGMVPGMVITVPGRIHGALGSSGQLVVRFYLPDGTPLLANPTEPFFRDANGLAATGTPVMPVNNDPANVSAVRLTIPYYALNFQPTGGVRQYPVQAQVTFYLNQFEKARSPFAPMTIRW
jgi:hypothetical protein